LVTASEASGFLPSLGFFLININSDYCASPLSELFVPASINHSCNLAISARAEGKKGVHFYRLYFRFSNVAYQITSGGATL
jgi:hypothetical protein